MNEFHEINILTSHGDIHGAFSLIRNWSENQARKIMIKAGYGVTPHTGRTFWMWVQETLTRSARQRRSGYQVRAERQAPVRRWREQAFDDYAAYAQMMESDATAQAEAAPEGDIAPPDAGPEKSIAVRCRAEGLIHLRRHGQPATARSVPVLQLHHTGGRIVTCTAKKRRRHVMSVHSLFPVMPLIPDSTGQKSVGQPDGPPYCRNNKRVFIIRPAFCYRQRITKTVPLCQRRFISTCRETFRYGRVSVFSLASPSVCPAERQAR